MGKREASVGLGMGSMNSPTHTQKDCVESDHSTLKLFAQFMKLPGWSCAALNFFISSHTAEYPM
eukprot:798560-Pelagomonas_calceolata.AAC.1